MNTALYATTEDDKGHAHHFKLVNGESAPDGHEIVGLRPAETFRFASLISPEARKTLTAIKR